MSFSDFKVTLETYILLDPVMSSKDEGHPLKPFFKQLEFQLLKLPFYEFNNLYQEWMYKKHETKSLTRASA